MCWHALLKHKNNFAKRFNGDTHINPYLFVIRLSQQLCSTQGKVDDLCPSSTLQPSCWYLKEISLRALIEYVIITLIVKEAPIYRYIVPARRLTLFPLKPIFGDDLSSAFDIFFNFNIFGKYLNESGREHSPEYSWHALDVWRLALTA